MLIFSFSIQYEKLGDDIFKNKNFKIMCMNGDFDFVQKLAPERTQ